jgi:hypothetical protein
MKMHEEDNINPLDEALMKHFAKRLDPQLGNAVARFAAHAMKDSQIAQNSAEPPARAEPRRGFWIATFSTSAVAAALIVGFAMFAHSINQNGNGGTKHGNPVVSSSQPTPSATDVPMERTLFWRTLDEGTVFLDDDTPARQLRRQQVEEVTWKDPASGEQRTSYSIPQEEVMFVAYNKY